MLISSVSGQPATHCLEDNKTNVAMLQKSARDTSHTGTIVRQCNNGDEASQ